jgi:hypothetical protein
MCCTEAKTQSLHALHALHGENSVTHPHARQHLDFTMQGIQDMQTLWTSRTRSLCCTCRMVERTQSLHALHVLHGEKLVTHLQPACPAW